MKETVTKTYLPQMAYNKRNLLTLINLTPLKKHKNTNTNTHTQHHYHTSHTVNVRMMSNKMSYRRLTSVYEDAKGKL